MSFITNPFLSIKKKKTILNKNNKHQNLETQSMIDGCAGITDSQCKYYIKVIIHTVCLVHAQGTSILGSWRSNWLHRLFL